MENRRPLKTGVTVPGTVPGLKMILPLLLAVYVQFAAVAENAPSGGEKIAFGASFSLHLQRGMNTFQLSLGPSASASGEILPGLELWGKAYTAAFIGHSSGVSLGASFAPRFGSWIPSAGAGLGTSYGNGIFFTKKLGASSLPDPFTFYGSVYLSPLRFTAGEFGFSVLDVGVGTDFREFGKSLVVDSSLLSLYFFPGQPAAGESPSVRVSEVENSGTGAGTSSGGGITDPPRWEIGIAAGLAQGIFSMLKVPNTVPVTASVLVRGFNLIEAAFVSTFSSLPPYLEFSPCLSAEVLAAPESGSYRPALGFGYGFMPIALSPASGYDHVVLNALYLTMIPARFSLMKTDRSSFFISALELRYGPFMPMGGFPKRTDAGNFILLVDFIKAGFTVAF